MHRVCLDLRLNLSLKSLISELFLHENEQDVYDEKMGKNCHFQNYLSLVANESRSSAVLNTDYFNFIAQILRNFIPH